MMALLCWLLAMPKASWFHTGLLDTPSSCTATINCLCAAVLCLDCVNVVLVLRVMGKAGGWGLWAKGCYEAWK